MSKRQAKRKLKRLAHKQDRRERKPNTPARSNVDRAIVRVASAYADALILMIREAPIQ